MGGDTHRFSPFKSDEYENKESNIVMVDASLHIVAHFRTLSFYFTSQWRGLVVNAKNHSAPFLSFLWTPVTPTDVVMLERKYSSSSSSSVLYNSPAESAAAHIFNR